ncbi:hypothetical protein P154DRAFT_576106 [Amniculicola lignicola CBS 123094]|uniref:Uncharacterized protein n=1 Tax=Amniculicola lignicola CBS 123094 TaxID=1392246 RepID=A0A6A5WH91_9PLEO|nr:hypothetical protein P154DRAFT_576106 [Amniculicola lignicola CBS 123094]
MAAQVQKSYTRILSLWPTDALRPNLPFTATIAQRCARYGIPISSPTTPGSTEDIKAKPSTTATKPATNPLLSALPTTTLPLNVKLEQRQIVALQMLLDNKYSKQYPLRPEVLKPRSNPEHYDRLMEEIERAPGKTWFQAKLDEWKMKIRWR